METVFQSEDLPPADRFGYWRECLSSTHAPLDMSSEHADDFRVRQRVLRLGAVTIWPATFQPMVCRRTPRLIRRSDPETYHLSLVRRGTAGASWGKNDVTYRPSDLHVQDSSRSCTTWAKGPGTIDTVGLEMPRNLLSLPQSLADRMIGRPVPGVEGIGALLSGFLVQLSSDAGTYRPSDGSRLGTVLIDLVSALFAHTVEAERELAPESRQRTLVLTVRAFIERHLHDPALTPASIAAAHHISLSYLHRVFQPDGTTVAVWIRRRRLERARRDLTDPALGGLQVGQIAARWGFSHPAVFTRAFRAAYDVSPSEFRRARREPDPA
ncbi:helix-turn-helix domain-containing protein [Actinomadura sp. WMMB 499]|uniref:helix-turn-helix domain-containing protein n=1 Tax=Actinomadura sp. WMMB 499 TaxID=1219491 RepID=UPI001243F04B|nr:helix-turn-helix domain-containing protein [Actinomadura sp. WMMB 499]QFG24668.1 helix-turn-helix domain-containing protein [Actinomadura sp. WMMB 499]